MRVRDCRGWEGALTEARRLRPDVADSDWARVGDIDVDWTYGDAPWFSLHPLALIEFLAA